MDDQSGEKYCFNVIDDYCFCSLVFTVLTLDTMFQHMSICLFV